MKAHIIRKIAVCLTLFAAVGAFDYLTGYEVSSYPMYLMPIFLTFFNFGKSGGYLACAVAISMWIMIDIKNGHDYSHEEVRYWNAFSRLLIYMMFVYGLSVYTKTVGVHRHRLEQMRQLIPMCHGCGRILWRDGMWRSPQEALEVANSEIPECPACANSGSKPSHES